MLKPILTVAMLCMLTIANAQLSLSVGPSIPIGKFGSDDLRSNSSGLAKSGVFISIGYTHPLSKNIGLTALLRGQQNALNTEGLENTFSTTPFTAAPVFSDGSTPPPPPSSFIFPNWTFNEGRWRMGSLLLGAQAQVPLKQKLAFVGCALLGPVYASAPEVKGQSAPANSNNNTAYMTQSGADAWGISYLIGGMVSYDVSKKLFINGGVELFGTNKITFKDITATFTNTWVDPQNPAALSISQMTMKADGKQTISTLNVSAGVGLRF